jgi:DUF1365 family protein
MFLKLQEKRERHKTENHTQLRAYLEALHSQNSHSIPSTPLYSTSYNELCLGNNFAPLHLFHHHKKKEDMNTIAEQYPQPPLPILYYLFHGNPSVTSRTIP